MVVRIYIIDENQRIDQFVDRIRMDSLFPIVEMSNVTKTGATGLRATYLVGKNFTNFTEFLQKTTKSNRDVQS